MKRLVQRYPRLSLSQQIGVMAAGFSIIALILLFLWHINADIESGVSFGVMTGVILSELASKMDIKNKVRLLIGCILFIATLTFIVLVLWPVPDIHVATLRMVGFFPGTIIFSIIWICILTWIAEAKEENSQQNS